MARVTAELSDWLLSLCVFYPLLRVALTESVARPSGFMRQARTLTFPYGSDESYLEFTFGVGLPMNLPSPYQVSMSLEIRADYYYPTNASDYTNPTKRREDKEKEKQEMAEKLAEMSSGVSSKTRINKNGVRVNVGEKSGEENIGQLKTYSTQSGCIYEAKISTKNTSKSDSNKSRDVTNKGCDDINLNSSKASNLKKGPELQKDNQLPNNSLKNESSPLGVNMMKNLDATKTQNELTINNTEKVDKPSEEKNKDNKKSRAKRIKKRDTGSRSTRWRIYYVLEMAANNVGMDGRACLLRSICEAAATPLHHQSNDILGELLHVLFTPSTTDDDRGRYLDNEYRAAEVLGSDVGNDCGLLYSECDLSFLDLITKFDLF